MSTNDPMTQEQLDAIQERAGEVTTLRSASFNDWQELALHLSECVDDLLAEVERLRALTTVDEDMVERAARSMSAHWHDWHTNEALGRQRALARAALDAALGTGEDA